MRVVWERERGARESVRMPKQAHSQARDVTQLQCPHMSAGGVKRDTNDLTEHTAMGFACACVFVSGDSPDKAKQTEDEVGKH